MFDSAYCCDPLCSPSRASLLTGLYVHNHQAYLNRTPWSFKHKTIAHHLGRAGYMTALIGKMHFVDAQTHGFDYKIDFNDWYQFLGPKTKLVAEEILGPNSGSGLPQIDDLWRDFGNPWTGVIGRDDREGPVSIGRPSALAEEDHFESVVTRESIRFIKEHGDEQPFFLISSFLKPHAPFTPALEYAGMYDSAAMQLPATWGKVDLDSVPKYVRSRIKHYSFMPEVHDPERARWHMAMYYACLSQMDANVGKILSALEQANLKRDTIILYLSDHGEMLGGHGLWEKNLFYEDSVCVPLMFALPNAMSAGKRCASPVSLAQVVPTLLDLCGLPIPAGLDGKSMVPSLRDPSRRVDQDILSEMNLGSRGSGFMLRSEDFKYCFSPHDEDELYDLKNDPLEMRNLARLQEYQKRKEELKGRLAAIAPLTL
jgi:choline-sulfatase